MARLKPRPLDLELEQLRVRLEEAEQTLRALSAGEVDSLVVEGPNGPRVYALEGSNNSYRVLVQEMNEGAATVTRDGTILYCNRRFAEVLAHPLEKVMGGTLRDHVVAQHLAAFDELCRWGWEGQSKGEVAIQRPDGSHVPIYLSISALVDEEPILCIIATDSDRAPPVPGAASERGARPSPCDRAPGALRRGPRRGVHRPRFFREEHRGKRPLLRAAPRTARERYLLHCHRSARPLPGAQGWRPRPA